MSKYIYIFSALAFILLACSSIEKGNKIGGTYEGIFKYKNFEVDLSFDVENDSSGYKVFFTSLGQNAFRIPTRNVILSADSLQFVLQSDFYTYHFSNKYDRLTNTFQGVLTVDSNEYPYVLKKVKAKDQITTKEVLFESNGNTLSGSIWEPAKANNTGLFIVSSSGYNDRSSSNAEALYFSKKGFTVFHFDKRGTGRSTGSLEDVSIEDLANDDINAIRYFSKKAGLPLSDIIIMGSSQGGAKVPLICNQLPGLKAGISISTTGCSLLESDLNFMMNRLKNEIDEKDFLMAKDVQKSVFEYLAGKLSKTELKKHLNEHKDKTFYQNLWIPALNDEIHKGLSYTPIPHFEKLQNPILIIQGLADIVIPGKSYVTIENALMKAGNKDYKIRTFENADHSMTLTEGNDFPYWSVLHPEYLVSIEDWIRSLSNKKHTEND